MRIHDITDLTGIPAAHTNLNGKLPFFTKLENYLKKHEELHLLSPGSSTLQSGVLITSVHLAKGLEFDRVIVPHVDDENYQTEVDRSMLYIACTRAMHRLTLTHYDTCTHLIN